MRKQKYPPGWDAESIRRLAEYHDNMTEDEQVAEIEAALSANGQTLILVPTQLVPDVEALIAKHGRRPRKPVRRKATTGK